MSQQAKFDHYAGNYDATLNSALAVTGESAEHFLQARLEVLVELVTRFAAKTPRTILDFGCGTGSAAPAMAAAFPGATVVGVDVSAESIEQARQLHGRSGEFFQLGCAEADNLSGCDLAYVNGVFHHIPPAERQRWLGWVRDRLNPGGLFALFENNPWNPGTRYVMSQCAFDDDAICLSPIETSRRLTQAGFRVLAHRHLTFFPASLRVLRPLERYLGRLPFGGQYVVLGRK